ncbi:MAG: class I SAM-dependent methyltransferase, partial [Planctomycetota bacterium]
METVRPARGPPRRPNKDTRPDEGSMQRDHLRHLVCPETLRPLELRAARTEGEDVLKGELFAGDRSYPLTEGIPGFVPPETLDSQTVRSFARKWDRHAYYRSHTESFYTQWYLDRYGFYDADGLAAFLRDARFILDAGTGMGRDALNLARHSGGLVFGVDTAWEALRTARRDLDHPRVALVHADLHHLPFPDGFFDVINCDQVIHHTPDPRQAFECLARKLRPGGTICCYVYRKKAVIREFVDDYVRERIRSLPPDEALKVCEAFTRLGESLAAMNVTVDVPEDIPLLGIRKGRMDLQRFFHWNLFKCFWNPDFDFHTNNIINFDWYHPEHCFRFDPEAFRAWFESGWEID